ncbi:MAG TPA: hypothetical protein VGN39_01185 [Terriglobales bacterium]|jgi:hypothetical protein|nr:hypothetical protein [Terriglobales bacterium]
MALAVVWAQDRGFPPESRLTSRQGYSGQEDVIDHKSVSKGTHLLCLQVEHHPKQTDDGAACFLRFQNGDKHTLKFGETMQANSDGEVYLECLGDKPTKCTAGLY